MVFPVQHPDTETGIKRVTVGGPGDSSCPHLKNLGVWFKYGQLPLISSSGAIIHIILEFVSTAFAAVFIFGLYHLVERGSQSEQQPVGIYPCHQELWFFFHSVSYLLI